MLLIGPELMALKTQRNESKYAYFLVGAESVKLKCLTFWKYDYISMDICSQQLRFKQSRSLTYFILQDTPQIFDTCNFIS